MHEAAGYILELHQLNVSTSWRTAQLSVFGCKMDRPLAAAIKERQQRMHDQCRLGPGENPIWLLLPVICQRLRNLLYVETGFQCHEDQG